MLCIIPSSYQILAPAQMQAEKDVKKAAGVCLEVIGLDQELYRLGHTKARIPFFPLQRGRVGRITKDSSTRRCRCVFLTFSKASNQHEYSLHVNTDNMRYEIIQNAKYSPP